MTNRWITKLVLVSLTLAAVSTLILRSEVVKAEPKSMPNVICALAAAATNGDSDYEYIGSSKCKMCHIKIYKSWEETKMGQAFETLKPGNASEAKQKHNLDPAKDYTKDETCLKCHTTGYGHETGYAIPDESDKKAVRAASKMESVGCESCHGPGSEYNKVFKDILKTKRKYKVDELHAVGLASIDASTCTVCHNDQSPTFDASMPFDFAKKKDEGTHVHEELQQREG